MVVVDTNVAVVANGYSKQASSDCVETCAKRLEDITRGEVKLVLDDKWIILGEYMRNLRSNGVDVGDRFLGWILRNWENPERCDLVSIAPINNSETEFQEFPTDPALNGFDRDDRKFIAVALTHPGKPPILQAVDSQWWAFRNAFHRNGVTVEFICQADIQKLHEGADSEAC